MPATVVDAVRSPFPCVCRCHERLSLDERAAGIAALFRFEDAMRGWGYEVVWDLAAPTLWRIQQQINNNDIRWVAVRDTGCIHSRLLGYCVHESIHALVGDTSHGNYGVPFGVPYGVPETVPAAEEANYLAEFNWQEARAWAGMAAVGYRLFGIEWTLRPARDGRCATRLSARFAFGFLLAAAPLLCVSPRPRRKSPRLVYAGTSR
jgi:hypothetical protein